MAGKNDPSIYDDRTTIGSSDELDEYGVWVKSEPQDLSSSLPELEDLPDMGSGLTDDLELPDFSDLDESGSESDTFLESDDSFESDLSVESEDSFEPDLSLESDTPLEFEEIPENSDLPEGLDPVPIDQDGFTEVSMSDFLDSESSLGPNSIDFGDLDSTVSDMEPENPSPPPPPAAPASGSGNSDLSNQLLMKIADELSSIKKELSSLKSELAQVRGDDTGKTETADAKSGGFFDEEDDEKIALTGDELDNILNTANFTEESGSGEALNEDISPADGETEESLDQEDIIGEDATVGFDEVDISELDGAVKVEEDLKNLSDDFDVSLDLSSDLPDFSEESELNSLREDGAQPLTPAPEDTSYLEEDLLAEDGSAEQIDFSEAVIDEPDLSSHITENPVSEPALDNISIDMEMEEQSVSEASGGGSDDFIFETEETMEIPVSEDPLIDDSGFGVGEEPWVPPAEPSVESSGIPETGDDFSDISFDIPEEDTLPVPSVPPAAAETEIKSGDGIPSNLKQELKTVLSYMDQLLESLPEDKIEEFAKSEYFDTYKKLFEELGLV